MNQVERWFGLLTGKLIRRGMHTSVLALENDIKAWIATWNDNPRPFTWTKTADEILNSLADYLRRLLACPARAGCICSPGARRLGYQSVWSGKDQQTADLTADTGWGAFLGRRTRELLQGRRP
jgi:hypothetical protein